MAGTDGRIRYVISKPMPSANISEQSRKMGEERREHQREYLALTDLVDPKMAYGDPGYLSQRSNLRMRIASLHRGVIS